MARWTVHGTREIYSSPWVCLRSDDVTLPSGLRVDHHVIDFPKPSVGAAVTDTDGRILLLHRHRHITNASGWEIHAGWAEPGEDLAEAARRETIERAESDCLSGSSLALGWAPVQEVSVVS
ncbi:NUDIX hydrolase [Catenulispora pinisilvae]|uniref:NUDIX hydrolase n=1 Tax=Catenulispora pinisilvae TaxID=2705253 RepID=UPI0018928807|nr:NUDIX domain-containing protein [Catenulispora pinisilvae]